MKKRFLCLTLGAVMLFSQTLPVGATSRKQELQQEKAAAESNLASQESRIDELENAKAVLQGEIDQLDADLVNILVQIDILEQEIADKEGEIEQTKADLTVAEQERDTQYEAMKKRIQYLYEKGGDNAWAQMLMQAKDITSLLNQAEYVQQMYDSDRRALENFKAIVQQVTDLQQQLEIEHSDLQAMQSEYEVQQQSLEQQLEEKKATSADYTSQIAVAEDQAARYAQLIREQNAELQQIEEAERKAAEEAARKAAEEAARKAAEEAEKVEAASKAASSSSTGTSNSGSSSSSKNNGSTNTSTGNNSGSSSSSGGNNTGSSSSSKGSSSGSSSGSGSGSSSSGSSSVPSSSIGAAAASYACNFVGNPYKWGGTSLTDGADCSGFVMSVYAKFGVSLPHSSSAMAGCGVGVSYSQAEPGDIICYSGHVAIYLGDGAIVHASNEAEGIKISYDATYRPIVAVRRVG